MELFQYAVIYEPTSEAKKKGEKPKLVVELATVLANDLQSATLLAGRAIPDEYLDRLECCKVAVRPF